MIRNQWYVVLQSKELKPGKPVGVTRMGEKMVFWRDSAGKPVCQADFCPHRGVALSIGCLKGDRIQCPFHGFEYDSTGVALSFRPTEGQQNHRKRLRLPPIQPGKPMDISTSGGAKSRLSILFFPGLMTLMKDSSRRVQRSLDGGLFSRNRKSTGCLSPSICAHIDHWAWKPHHCGRTVHCG